MISISELDDRIEVSWSLLRRASGMADRLQPAPPTIVAAIDREIVFLRDCAHEVPARNKELDDLVKLWDRLAVRISAKLN